MTVIDFIDLSNEDEIPKDHMSHTGGHNVHQGLDIVDLNSDEETAKEDCNACKQGHAAVVQHQASAHDGEAVFVPAGDGNHHTLQSENSYFFETLQSENSGEGCRMTVTDFIDLSTEDEILKDHMSQTGSHDVHQELDTVDLNSDEEMTKEDYSATQGHAVVVQHQASAYDGEAVLVPTGDDSHLAMLSENAGATSSIAVIENGGLCATALQEGMAKEDRSACTQGRMVEHRASFHDGQAVPVAEGASTKQAMESKNTVQATTSFSSTKNGSFGSTTRSQNNQTFSNTVPFPKENRAATQTATYSPSTACKAQSSKTLAIPWSRPRLKQKRKSSSQEPPLHPYEALHLQQCMRNRARLQQLGIPVLGSMFANKTVISLDKNKPKHSISEDSDSEYDPGQDDTCEGELCAANKAKKALKARKTCNKTRNKRAANMAHDGIKPRPPKRVVADPTTRATRSKKSLSDIPLPTPSVPHTSQAEENVGSLDDPTQPFIEDDGLDQPNSNSPISNGSDGTANQQGNDTAQPKGHNQVASEGDGTAQPYYQNHIRNNSEEEEPCNRRVNMGKARRRLSRARRVKLPVVITEGRIRPVLPVVAAKFATECNIVVRNHVPVLKNWKYYKKQPDILRLFMEKLAEKLNIDISAAPVKKACSEMMKSAIRQQRHRLKKEYFNPYPLHLVMKTSPIKCMTDIQWNDLVESWKSPKKMNTCERNKINRSNVKFHQTTGSRSYMVHLENLGDKYKDEEPDALDLFKECHYSNKNKGYTDAVQSAITQMENKISELAEHQQDKSVIEVVAGVLAENTKKSMFLQNVGIQNSLPTSDEQNLEADE